MTLHGWRGSNVKNKKKFKANGQNCLPCFNSAVGRRRRMTAFEIKNHLMRILYKNLEKKKKKSYQ